MIRRCAWCGRIWDGGSWTVSSNPVALALARERLEVTDGICPDCAARYEAELVESGCEEDWEDPA